MKKNEVLKIPLTWTIKLKTLIIMKLLLFNCIVLVSISANVLPQGAFSLDITNKTFREALKAIEQSSELHFFYNEEFIDLDKKVDLKVKNVNERELLDQLFKEQLLTYQLLDDNLVVITPSGLKQEITIKGRVTDKDNSPLPGVNIIEKGTSNGTVSDLDGNYTLSVSSPDAVISFSFIGFLSEDISVGGQSTIDIVLLEDIEELEEVVVIGYGTVKKSDLTGSVTSIKNEDLNQGAISSIDQAMQGRIAGVQITQASSEPGGGLSIRIRGATSINAGNEPLYVIDGLPIDNGSGLSGSSSDEQVANVSQNLNTKNPLNSLNPNDIESIEILKDASATAIYGSRGANGVVLITTKKGSNGVKFSYDAYAGTQRVAKMIDILETSEYIETINTMSTEMGNEPVFSQDDITRIGDGTNWQEEIFQTAPIQSHNLSMSGGVEKTKYYVSLNYFDQQGVVKETGTKRYIARVNVSQEIGKRVNFGVNINTSRENSDNYIGGVSTNESAGPVNTALLYDPTEPIYDDEGNYSRSTELTINNPLSTVYGISSKSETNRMFGNLTLDYKIMEALTAKVNVGFDNQNMRRDLYNSRKTIHGNTNNGQADVASLDRSNVLFEYTMNYSKTINDNHSISILGGVTYQDFMLKRFSAGTNNFPSDDLGTDNLGLGDPTNASISSLKEENTLLSYLGRINYSFYNFLFTSSIRADGSSRFGENNKFGYFPSFALGWKLAEEDFIPEVFSELKLRASWGQTGNQEITNYLSLSTYDDGGNAILGGSVYVGTEPSRIANPDLKWETTEQLNVGVDFGFLDGRISGTFDYFNKKTTDMLLELPLPTSSGYSSIMKNVGSMENKGVELMLNSRNIIKGNFTWKTTFNISAVKNEVTSLGSLESIVTGYIQAVGNTVIIKPGLPLSSYYGYRIIGIFQDQDEIDGYVQPTAQPGYPKFDNINDDGQISTDDQVVLGNPFPDFTFGIRNSFTYKNFDLDIFFQGQQGASLLNNNAIESMYPANFRRNRIAAQIEDRWTTDNPDAKWPSGINTSAYGGGKVSNLVIEDASYIRLKSLQLNYTIPVKFWGLQSAKVYISGQNLLTITDYSGYDPEANAFGQGNARIDYNAYPLAKTWMLGLNVQF